LNVNVGVTAVSPNPATVITTLQDINASAFAQYYIVPTRTLSIGARLMSAAGT
jgi:hypothetical protein